MRKNRILFLVVAVMMLGAMLVACGSNNNTKPVDVSIAPSSTAAASKAPSGTPTATPAPALGSSGATSQDMSDAKDIPKEPVSAELKAEIPEGIPQSIIDTFMVDVYKIKSAEAFSTGEIKVSFYTKQDSYDYACYYRKTLPEVGDDNNANYKELSFNKTNGNYAGYNWIEGKKFLVGVQPYTRAVDGEKGFTLVDLTYGIAADSAG